MFRRLLVAALVVAPLLVPPAGAVETQAQVVTIQTSAGRYRAVITDPAMVELARRELAGGGDVGVPIGPLAWGSGGVNHGHRWQVTELSFADLTIELCDGTARAVDRDTRYWVETVGNFCPWNGEVVRLTPLRPR